MIGDGMGPQQVGLLKPTQTSAKYSIKGKKNGPLSNLLKKGYWFIPHIRKTQSCGFSLLCDHAYSRYLQRFSNRPDSQGNHVETVPKAKKQAATDGSDTRLLRDSKASFALTQPHRSLENQIISICLATGADVMPIWRTASFDSKSTNDKNWNL